MKNRRVVAAGACHTRPRFPFGANPVGTAANLDNDRLFARVERCVGPGSPEDRGQGEFPESRVIVFRQIGGEIIADQPPRFGPELAMSDSSLFRRDHSFAAYDNFFPLQMGLPPFYRRIHHLKTSRLFSNLRALAFVAVPNGRIQISAAFSWHLDHRVAAKMLAPYNPIREVVRGLRWQSPPWG